MLNITFLANQGAPESVFNNGIKRFEKIISSENFTIVSENPDILFFLTGGAETIAKTQILAGHFYILIGSKHDNAYASATEVKAFLNSRNIPSLLLDEDEAETAEILHHILIIKRALQNLQGKKLGLIGQVSDWLISSNIAADLLEKKLGIKLLEIPWSNLAHFSEFNVNNSFHETYPNQKVETLTETAKVHQMLLSTIKERQLDAITVECFPLVKNYCVTACLSLAKLNNDGFAAGCEGDITAITGMMLCKEVTGIIPWIANINKVSNEVCMFSHCTIAPNLVSEFAIQSHFETNEGLAIQGKFKGDTITIFRFDHKLSKAFIATSNITARPNSETACRTQIEVKLNEKDVKLLQQNPLGNHHLIIPGNYSTLLQRACMVLGIEVL